MSERAVCAFFLITVFCFNTFAADPNNDESTQSQKPSVERSARTTNPVTIKNEEAARAACVKAVLEGRDEFPCKSEKEKPSLPATSDR